MQYGVVNPSDLNIIEGTYGQLPPLPAILGNEGVGMVHEVGPEVLDLKVGDAVLPLAGGGLWASSVILDAAQLLRLPAGISLKQAAQLRINPATAELLLTSQVPLQEGDWIVQNAANSAVGLSVQQLATARGLHVLNLVRRPAAEMICREHGASHVLLENDPAVRQRAEAFFGENRPKLALNAVGGESALLVAGMLAQGGTCVTFGAMSKKKLSLPNRFLIFQELHFKGFWLSGWLQNAAYAEVQALYARLANEIAAQRLRLPVQHVFALADIHQALSAAQKLERNGKILLQIS
jgi:NADPH:quinone reductase-like Zn-dependent oxidoreductase